MKIYNIKITNFKIPLIIFLFLLAIILCNFLSNSNTINMTSENYSQILKQIHDAPYKFENKKIKMVGYVFRASDFKPEQFVIARDMLINESESRIIGFLCESSKSLELQNNEWIYAKRSNICWRLSWCNANCKNYFV